MRARNSKNHQADEVTECTSEENHELLPPAPKVQDASSKHTGIAAFSQRKSIARHKIHWRTLASMLSLFLLAFVVSVVHLSIFLYLNGKPADGRNAIPQNYVATLSHFLALVFRTVLCGSLYIAYTQCLWRLMRIKTLNILSVDRLFRITTNPLVLSPPELLEAAPKLYGLALFAFLLPIAITFPQGALIVTSTKEFSKPAASVFTYNGTYLGNGSSIDAFSKAWAVTGLQSSQLYFANPRPIISRLGRLVVEAGDITTSSSPCGLDCSYRVQFEGPYVRCETNSSVQDPMVGTGKCGYDFFRADTPNLAGDTHPENFSISATSIQRQNSTDTSFNITQMTCIPSRALYSSVVSFFNGSRSISYAAQYISSLAAMTQGSINWSGPSLECQPDNPPDDSCYAKLNWTQSQRDTLAGWNHYSVIYSFIDAIQGTYDMTKTGYFAEGDDPPAPCDAPTTAIGYTRFNTQRDNTSYATNNVIVPDIIVTEDLMNEALFNMTMSMALQLGFYNDTVTTNITTTYNIYSFAKFKQFYIPYLLCLAIALPFIVLGVISLYRNGVSAMDGGFLQILVTTTGSERLTEAAAAGCLGGEESIPLELKKINIRFGEIKRGTGNGRSSVASFGLADEVAPLRAGVLYGA